MNLNVVGKIANDTWLGLTDHFPNIRLSAYVVMPNHLHGIVSIQQRAVLSACHTSKSRLGTSSIDSGSLPAIVRSYKAAVSKAVRRLAEQPSSEVWQRGYYEHIIRDQRDYKNICEYIRLNPARWRLDAEKPTYTSATQNL
jgi:putative transposase